jgi:hypothetical protein
MSSEPDYRPDEIQKMFHLQDQATANFRAELANRGEGEVRYDECLLSHLRKGKSFKIALRKANKKFPDEALNPSREELADAEEHYRFFLEMEGLDENRREVENHMKQIQESDRKIAEIDKKVAALLETMANLKASAEADTSEDQK